MRRSAERRLLPAYDNSKVEYMNVCGETLLSNLILIFSMPRSYTILSML